MALKGFSISKEMVLKYTVMVMLAILLLLSGIFMVHGYINNSFDSVQTFREYVGTYGIYGPVVFGLIQMLQVIVPVMPGIIGCAAGVGIFGVVGGFCFMVLHLDIFYNIVVLYYI